ncbi:MAG: tRNA (N6-threonylcarbamoyladenosine(37)-N6)-methyltransferase TrmO [Polyangiales bacterium]
MSAPPSLTLTPIGVARTPFGERFDAPRQPRAALGFEGRIELYSGRNLEDAVSDLEEWTHIWVLFWFHRNPSWRPKVTPPRSPTKRGVLSTRAPHRPNPLGLSVVRLERVEGLTVFVRDIDLLDETPVLDIKPYVPWADAIPDAGSGWLEPLGSDGRPVDPGPAWEVTFSEEAEAQLSFLEARGVMIRVPIVDRLSIGPQPHAYRRIRAIAGSDTAFVLAFKTWRLRFELDGRVVRVCRLCSGYPPAQRALADPEGKLDVHREYASVFGDPALE